jgi:ribonuclease T2
VYVEGGRDWSALVSTPAYGEVELSGSFTATQACRAFQSIQKQSNPGNVTIEPGRPYPILGKNNSDATYYQITIEGAAPEARWVSVSCGRIDEANARVSLISSCSLSQKL